MKPKPSCGHVVDVQAGLVEPRGEADGVRKAQSHHLAFAGVPGSKRAADRKAARTRRPRMADAVCVGRGLAEEQGAYQSVEHLAD